MKKSFIFMLGVLLLFFFPSTIAFTIETDVSIEPSASNTSYEFSTSYILSSLEVKANTPLFNGNIFQVEADNGSVNVTIHSLNSMRFTVNASSNVVFTLGGFSSGSEYDVFVDDVKWQSFTVDGNGVLSFSYDSWSIHSFSFSLISISGSDVTINLLPLADVAIGLISIMIIMMVLVSILIILKGGDPLILVPIALFTVILFVGCIILVLISSSLSVL